MNTQPIPDQHLKHFVPGPNSRPEAEFIDLGQQFFRQSQADRLVGHGPSRGITNIIDIIDGNVSIADISYSVNATVTTDTACAREGIT